MVARIQVAPGVFIDARSVPLALITLFEGWPAGLAAGALAIVYRASLGGAGAPAGIAGVVAVIAVAMLVRAWARRDGRVTLRHAAVLGLAVFLTTLGAFALLGMRGLTQFSAVWLPHIAMYGIGIAFIARLFGDVAERASLAAEHRRFRAVIDAASDAIRIVDPETQRIVDCNRADCEMSGYSREEMIGRDVREFWPDSPEVRAEREVGIARARATGIARQFGLPYRTRAGRVIRVDSTRRIAEHAGRCYDIGVFRDASEREAAEAAQREAADLRAINLVAQAAAHEINNPLAVVLGSLDLLSRRYPREAGHEGRLIAQAAAAGERIRDIVARMTHITRVETEPTTGTLPEILDIHKSSDTDERTRLR